MLGDSLLMFLPFLQERARVTACVSAAGSSKMIEEKYAEDKLIVISRWQRCLASLARNSRYACGRAGAKLVCDKE